MALAEESYGTMQVNGPVWEKDSGNKERREAAKPRRKRIGKTRIWDCRVNVIVH